MFAYYSSFVSMKIKPPKFIVSECNHRDAYDFYYLSLYNTIASFHTCLYKNCGNHVTVIASCSISFTVSNYVDLGSFFFFFFKSILNIKTQLFMTQFLLI